MRSRRPVTMLDQEKASEAMAGFNYADFDSAMSKFDTTFQVCAVL